MNCETFTKHVRRNKVMLHRAVLVACCLALGTTSCRAFVLSPCRTDNNRPKQISRTHSLIKPLLFVRSQVRLQGSAKSSEPEDVPEDWDEEDILAELDGELEDITAPILDEDIEDPTVVTVKSDAADDDDDGLDDDDLDDDDLDEIDLDLDDDDDDESGDEDLVEEEGESAVVAEYDDAQTGTEYYDDEIEWDEDEDGGNYELLSDPDDPNYMRQKELVEEAIQASEKRRSDESFDATSFIENEMTEEDAELFEQLPMMEELKAKVSDMLLTEDDVAEINIENDLATVTDLMDDDSYLRHEEGEFNILQESVGLTDDDMQSLDDSYKEAKAVADAEPWDKVLLKDMTGWDGLSNKTVEEMEACLDEIGGSAYNVTRWLLYDLDFNVSNLLLSAIKHNPKAPILFQHWYPQLVTYERYQHARDRNYDFTWQDIDDADVSELERYYAGFGYNEIPTKAPAETGIISLEDLDEEEIKMAAFENWMTTVYNPEADRKDFDDDELRDEDNVFSDFYQHPQHPDLPTAEDAEEDIKEWNEELGDDPAIRGYRDMMGRTFDYKATKDEEFQREFRGHLVIACTGEDSDLEIAEKVTQRFEIEFGKSVYVETQVHALARPEDNVFEIWLESYDIDLLHSKKRATSNAKGWDGPAEVDDTQVDWLVERVRFLISDDARYGYRYFEFEGAL